MQQQSISPDIVEKDGYNRCSVIDNRCSGASPCRFCKRIEMSKSECADFCTARKKFSDGIEYKESDIYGNYHGINMAPFRVTSKKSTKGMTKDDIIKKMNANVDRCKRLYESGVKTVSEISEITGIHKAIVSKHLSRAGISVQGDNVNKKIEISRKCKELSRKGLSVKKISLMVGAGEDSVRVYLSDMFESTLFMGKKDRISICKTLKGEGLSTYAISRKIGLNQGTVSIYLSR